MDELRQLRVLLFEAVRLADDHKDDCADPHDNLDRPCPCGWNDFVRRAMEKLMPYCGVCGDVAIPGYDYCAEHFKTTTEELVEAVTDGLRAGLGIKKEPDA